MCGSTPAVCEKRISILGGADYTTSSRLAAEPPTLCMQCILMRHNDLCLDPATASNETPLVTDADPDNQQPAPIPAPSDNTNGTALSLPPTVLPSACYHQGARQGNGWQCGGARWATLHRNTRPDHSTCYTG
ncbi:hypothetical protein PR048_020857 [Dryococelus australis]|uniref:Uncharacterized protein n=1 Tax=Dryococelus australis TaxID=614101 RepID=A0ABQ9GWK6_9NEOP|nr:hypothetical protein PR048_020857 [Dryococelus australis]